MSLQSVRFMHSSDWRLETPIGGVVEVPLELREAFLDAPYVSAERVVQAALEHQVDFLVLAGDILPIELASPYTWEFLLRQFERLAEQEILVYWLGGQLDDLDLWPSQLQLPQNVRTFPAGSVQHFDHRREGRTVARLLGQSQRRGATWRASDYAGSDESTPRIALAYGDMAKRTLENKGVDYWALGGQDRHRVLLHGKTTAAYSGSPQGRAPAESDAHGAVLVELTFGQATTRLIETDLWRWRREKVQAADLDSIEALQTHVIRQLNQISCESSQFGWLLVWSVICQGKLAERLRSPEHHERLLRALRQASAHDARWSLVVDVEPAELPGDLFEEDTILGDFLRAVQRLEHQGEAWQELVAYLPDSDLRETLLSDLQQTSDERRSQLWRRVAAWGADLLRGEVGVESTSAPDAQHSSPASTREPRHVKITDLEVSSFGHWKGLQIPAVSGRVSVIHGPNEAGKSTLLHLIRAILYGFSSRHHARFVPPRHPGPVGGKLTVTGPNGRYEIRRWLPESLGLQEDQVGDLAVQSVEGGLKGKHLLGSLLCGVDEAIFQNVFAVGLSEMQQLGTLSDTAAAQQLYGLAAGADRVSVAEVARQLAEARHRRLEGREPSALRQLLAQRAQLQKELAEERSLTPRWLKLVDEQRAMNAELAELESTQRRFGRELTQAETRDSLREKWKTCRRLHQKLTTLGPLPDIPSEVVQRIEQAGRQLRQRRQSWEKLRQRRRDLRQQANQLAGQPALMHYADQIHTLQQRAPVLATLDSQVEKLKATAEETEFELQGELERLGLKAEWQTKSLPLITDEMLTALTEPAHEARAAHEQAEAAEQAEREGQQTVEKIERQLASTLEKIQQPDVTTALRQIETRIQSLRDRIQIQGKYETSQRNLKDLLEECQEWTRRQLVPWRGLMIFGMTFSLGTILVLVAWFGRFFGVSGDQRWTLGMFGGAIAAGSLIVKAILEFAAGRSVDGCRAEIQSERKQLGRLRAEIQQLDSQLGTGAEPWAVRLEEAEDEWQLLSNLQPLEAQRLKAVERVEQARGVKQQAENRETEGHERWRQQLREFGLPEKMTPNQFRQLAQADSGVGRLRQRVVEAHRETRLKQSELQEMRERIEAIFQRAHLVPESDRLDEQAEQLSLALQEARQNHQQREALHRKWRDAGRDQQKLARDAKRLQQRRQQLVAKYGVVDAQELKAMVKRRTQGIRLRRQRDQLLREIVTSLGECCTLAQLRKDLAQGDFELRLRGWEQELQQLDTGLAQLHERRGEIGQQLKQLAAQRQGSQKRLALDEIETQIQHQMQQWEALAATSLILDSVRKSYESERQPETLAEASSYLRRLTAGRYPRIWTPFGESALCVDDQQGRPIRVEHLSRGTREQVFLSLRLALAAAYSRRGAGLPLILDDVFVNFDAKRAVQAAETICEFAAAGHQVLVFTCHSHLRDVFHRLGVDLRELPDAAQIAEHPEPLLAEPPWSEVESKVASLPSPRPPEPITMQGLPADGDPELDHELLYGAPEYDPGYEPRQATEPAEPPAARPRDRKRRRKRRRPSRSQRPDEYLGPPLAARDTHAAELPARFEPAQYRPLAPVSATTPVDYEAVERASWAHS